MVRVWWQYGRTALMLASENGKVEAIKVLVGNGADVHATDEASAALAASIARTAVWRVCGYDG